MLNYGCNQLFSVQSVNVLSLKKHGGAFKKWKILQNFKSNFRFTRDLWGHFVYEYHGIEKDSITPKVYFFDIENNCAGRGERL